MPDTLVDADVPANGDAAHAALSALSSLLNKTSSASSSPKEQLGSLNLLPSTLPETDLLQSVHFQVDTKGDPSILSKADSFEVIEEVETGGKVAPRLSDVLPSQYTSITPLDSTPLVDPPKTGRQRPQVSGRQKFNVQFEPPPSKRFDYPPNSRLFLGNLAGDRTSREEIADIFAYYGNITEISLKPTFGFVQFDSAEACKEAIENEQGRPVGGQNLKLSKDNRPWAKQSGKEPAERRSSKESVDSRDTSRQGHQRVKGRNRGGLINKNFQGHPRNPREQAHPYIPPNEGRRRPRRSSSPPISPRRGQWDENSRYPPNKGRLFSDLFQSMVVGHFQSIIHKTSHIPPHMRIDDPYPLPRRYAPHVPECQMIAYDAGRHYISKVENVLRGLGMSVEVLFISPKLNLHHVVGQIIEEGVKCLVFLSRQNERNKTVEMLIRHLDPMSFKEYDDIALDSVEPLLANEMEQWRHVRPRLPLPPGPNAQLANVLTGLLNSGNVDPQTLVTIVSALQQQQQPPPLPQQPALPHMLPPYVPTSTPLDHLLGSLGQASRPIQPSPTFSSPNPSVSLSTLLAGGLPPHVVNEPYDPTRSGFSASKPPSVADLLNNLQTFQNPPLHPPPNTASNPLQSLLQGLHKQ